MYSHMLIAVQVVANMTQSFQRCLMRLTLKAMYKWERMTFRQRLLSCLGACFVLGCVYTFLQPEFVFPKPAHDYIAAVQSPKGFLSKSLRTSSVALGCALTTAKHVPQKDAIGFAKELFTTSLGIRKMLSNLPFFRTMLPSFCQTASLTFSYKFYVAYDHSDLVLNGTIIRKTFQILFDKMTKEKCFRRYGQLGDYIDVKMQFVKCNHDSSPSRAHNDAIMAAYKDSYDYFYRINQDTEFHTVFWTEAFVKTLGAMKPPNIGVIGPSHYGLNLPHVKYPLLTYEFVHRSHIDIFSYYYPPLLTGWYADDWIVKVYQSRSKRLIDVAVKVNAKAIDFKHREESVVTSHRSSVIEMDRHRLQEYINAVIVE